MSEENNEDKKNSFSKTFFEYLDKGVEASKKGLKTASTAVSDFGDKTVLKIELTQLNNKVEKKYTELGKLMYKESPLVIENEEIKKVIQEINDLNADIEKHKAEIN